MAIAMLALAAFAVPAAAQAPQPKPVQMALVGPGTLSIEGVGSVPGVLSPADVAAYRAIFAYQDDGKWAAADAQIARLRDRRLMGHVLAQRYLHPDSGRTSWAELSDWMATYADLPQAPRLYTLAVRRQPRGAAGPQRPTAQRPPLPAYSAAAIAPTPQRANLSAAERRTAARLLDDIEARARRGSPTPALETLNGAEARRLLSPAERSRGLAAVAQGYFRTGPEHDTKAVAAAREALGTGEDTPMAFWWGGLAAFRAGRVEDAQRLFTALARSASADDWNLSSGAFWAARAYLLGGKPEKVNDMLALGATRKLTFYGILSRRALGLDLDLDWNDAPLDTGVFAALAATPAGSRAIGLLQVGRSPDAEQEMMALAGAEPGLIPALTGLAVHARLAALAYRLAVAQGEGAPIAALYPLPDWEPADGFTVDRALVFAIVRQESAFNERAISPAGARGLMQLMPRTASFVGGERSLAGNGRNRLLDPALNLTLGQAYVNRLLADQAIGTDLFRLAVAYNAGPGNLKSWDRNNRHSDDPLLFIESLPARETRLFIERLLTNYWVYRHRLGQPSTALDDLAAGTWPAYLAQD
ncbi:MAG: transglycosylase SLT domain-containing protein [Alphaproteobacteria bacterium]